MKRQSRLEVADKLPRATELVNRSSLRMNLKREQKQADLCETDSRLVYIVSSL